IQADERRPPDRGEDVVVRQQIARVGRRHGHRLPLTVAGRDWASAAESSAKRTGTFVHTGTRRSPWRPGEKRSRRAPATAAESNSRKPLDSSTYAVSTCPSSVTCTISM